MGLNKDFFHKKTVKLQLDVSASFCKIKTHLRYENVSKFSIKMDYDIFCMFVCFPEFYESTNEINKTQILAKINFFTKITKNHQFEFFSNFYRPIFSLDHKLPCL
jgi:hypothetical protein